MDLGVRWSKGSSRTRIKETQKLYGLLVVDVMKSFPTEIEELTHVVKYLIYNTPGVHGYTPRDLDRRWSAASPLERDLQPFRVPEFEPASEYIGKLFANYRLLRTQIAQHLHSAAERRQELANRHRPSKEIKEHQKVVLRDPRQRKAGGRAPYRQPLTDPCEVIKARAINSKFDGPMGRKLTTYTL